MAKKKIDGQLEVTGQVTIPETPVADTDAASKKYVDDTAGSIDLSEYAKKIGELPHFSVLNTTDVLDFIVDNNANGKPIVLIHSINSYIGQFRVLRATTTAYIGFYFKALDGGAVYSGGFDVSDISTPSPKFSDLFSNTYLNSVALTKGKLPMFTVSGTDNVADFITNNNVNKQPIIVTFTAFNQVLLGVFSASGQTGHYHFEFEELTSTQRFFGQNIDLTNMTFSSLFLPLDSNPYLDSYEIQSNKVTSLSVSSTNEQYPSAKLVYDQLLLKENVSNKVTALSDSSTDTQYPSAKVVWDNVQNVREVAEGKCNTIVLSYTDHAPTSDAQAQQFKRPNGTAFASLTAFNNYIGNANLINSNFNSQNSDLSYAVSSGSQHYYIISKDKTVYRDFEILNEFKSGDVFLVIQLNVPDRWLDLSAASVGIFVFQKLETSKIDLTSYPTFSNLNSILGDVICGVYNNTATYALNDIVIHDNKLYRCTTAITTAEDWDATHWTVTDIKNEFAKLDGNNAFTGNNTHSGEEIFNEIHIPISADGTTKVGKITQVGNYYLAIKVNNDNFALFDIQAGAVNFTHILPVSNNSRDIGSASTRWRKVYTVNLDFSGVLNPNANGFGLVPPDTSGFTANKELATTDLGKLLSIESQRHLTSGEAKRCVGGIQVVSDYYLNLGGGVLLKNPYITGIQSSSVNIDITAYGIDNSSRLVLYTSRLTINTSDDSVAVSESNIKTIKVGNNTIIPNRLDPDSDNSQNIGRDSLRWKDGYFAGQVYAQNTYNIIDVSEMTDSLHFTQDQLAIIENGKPTKIIGSLNSQLSNVFITSVYSDTTSLYCLLSYANSSTIQGFSYITITKSNGFINIRGNYIRFGTNAIYLNTDNGGHNTIYINGKQLPDYPSLSSSDIQKQLIYKNDNTMAWDNVSGFKVIPAPSSTILTDSEIADIIAGCQLTGDFSNLHKPTFYPAHDTSSQNLYRGYLTSINQYGQLNIGVYNINQTTKVFSKVVSFSIGPDGKVSIINLNQINSKSVNYYQNNIYPYASNSTTQLKYEEINNISISADTTFTLATAPNNTYPEYKANITNTDTSNAITVTLPSYAVSGGTTKIKGNVSISNNTFEVPAGATVELNIQQQGNDYHAIVVEW